MFSEWYLGFGTNTGGFPIKLETLIKVQFPNSIPVIVNLDLTLNFDTLIGRPQCNGRFCWQASLLHLRPSFSVTRMITRTIYVQDLSSGTVLSFLFLFQCVVVGC